MLANFLYFLSPVSAAEDLISFRVVRGEGLEEVSARLKAENLIRSKTAFKIYAFISSSAHQLKPGDYFLNLSLSAPRIIKNLTEGPVEDITITIIEGQTVKDIDGLLSAVGILKPGELLAYRPKDQKSLEGYLFPDTYRFFPNSPIEDVVKKFLDNFEKKARPLLMEDGGREALIMASLIEKEIPLFDDRVLVSGILWKRLAAGMGLQVDAAICYAKLKSSIGCRLAKADFAIDSSYNTYKYAGLPPTPIGNPSLSAINAARNPKNSEYWYYLSDPKTKKTIFSRTLEEHNEKRAKYLSY